jgi:uncharacterized protein
MTSSSDSPHYLYLHGFASGPQSTKSQYLCDRFAEQSIPLQRPDLNQTDFFSLTLTRQIQQCEAMLAQDSKPWTIIGSSFGGLTAAWLGQRNLQVNRLVLLAPAFDFLAHWQLRLGTAALQEWQASGSTTVYHYAEQRSLPLSYGFWQDASQYAESVLTRAVPTLILHGVADEIIPIETSRAFAAQRDWCRLIELQSDHGLGDVLPTLWDKISGFLSVNADSANDEATAVNQQRRINKL